MGIEIKDIQELSNTEFKDFQGRFDTEFKDSHWPEVKLCR